MTTSTRRAFLQTLTGLAVAPIIAARVLAAAKPTNLPMLSGVDRSNQPDTHCAWVSRSILVPSNRFQTYRGEDGSISWGHLYEGDWDGTLKLEAGCTNPAYVLADLLEHSDIDHAPDTHLWDASRVGPDGWERMPLNWQALYDWGCYTDEPVTAFEIERHGPHGYSVFGGELILRPRFTTANLHVAEGDLRRSLETHFKVWMATDERYRRSFPVLA